MPQHTGDLRGAEFTQADLTGATFHRVHLNDARLRLVDLSGAVLRAVDLSGASVDGEIDGLVVNGVEVAPLVAAELARREPVRALLGASDPAGLRAAWKGLQDGWATTYDRVAALPAGTVDRSVDGEWSFAETLRHLVFATDGWLGAVRGEARPFHPWGVPFTDVTEFADPVADLGLDPDAAPSYAEVLALRADRVARVREFLTGVSQDRLAEECDGPPWAGGRPTVLDCLHVILDEECEHRRYAARDLDVLASE